MRQDDYKCVSCGKIISYQAKPGESFPDTIDCGGEKCKGSEAERITSVPYTETAEGQLGNGANGYTGSFAYTSSRLTPLNVLKSDQKRSDSGI
jgi:hypothetical protein